MAIPVRNQIKLINFIIAGVMLTVGFLDFVFGEGGFISIKNIVPLYLILFGCMTIAGDFEIQFVIKWCGFLGHYTMRGIFTFYCGLNLLVARRSLTNMLQPIAVIGGWGTCIFALIMLFIGCFMKDSLYAKEMEEYLHEKNPVESFDAGNGKKVEGEKICN